MMKGHQKWSSLLFKELNGTSLSSGLLTVKYMAGFMIPEESLVKVLV